MGKLSGSDIDGLSRKISDAVDRDDLKNLVHVSTGDRLFSEYVGDGKPNRPTIVDLLNALEERGTTPLFLREVYARRPGRPDLRAAITALYPEAADAPPRTIALSAQNAGRPQDEAPTNALAPGLQRNIRPHLPQLDVRIWQEQLIRIERRVCIVEHAGAALGTGFLVGPEVVLTNWHVWEAAEEAGGPGELRCRFDFVKLPDGTKQAGQAVALHADGCVASSRYSPAEATRTPDTPPPKADELDYALLRLASAVGDQVVEGVPRGWLALSQAAFQLPENAPLLILQHPKGEPMKMALDTQSVIGRTGGGNRIRYRTNTEGGSSGSPCFTMDWDLVALHHYGDPAWNEPLYNQGVPIELVRRHIETAGMARFLGA